MMRLLIALAPLAFLTLAGCAGGGEATVTVTDNQFSPRTLTVDSGDEVHFEVSAQAKNPHTVTITKSGAAANVLLDEPVSAGSDTHFTFPSAGTYDVKCKIHGAMTMVVTVE